MTKQTELEQLREAVEFAEYAEALGYHDYKSLISGAEKDLKNGLISESQFDSVHKQAMFFKHVKQALTENLERLETGGWRDIRNEKPNLGDVVLAKYVTNEKTFIGSFPNQLPYVGRFVEEHGDLFFETLDYYGDVLEEDAQKPTHWQPIPTNSKGGRR